MKFIKKSNSNYKLQTTIQKKKKFYSNKKDRSSVEHQQRYTKIFYSTTFLNRSPSNSFEPPQLKNKMSLSRANYSRNNQNGIGYSFNAKQSQISTHHCESAHDRNFINNQKYKKRQKTTKKKFNTNKNIEILSNFNEGNFLNGFQQQNDFNVFNSDQAANNLANIFQSDLKINLTQNEPRKILYHNHNTNNSQNHFMKIPKYNSTMTNHRFQKLKNTYQPNQLNELANQCPGYVSATQHHYVNRFKYVKQASLRNHAPYNTTQYIMYDYSKRRSTDKKFPNEQQQFSDDWDMALVNGTSNTTESLNKLAKGINNLNNINISNNSFISLNENDNLNEVPHKSLPTNQFGSFNSTLGRRLNIGIRTETVTNLENMNAAVNIPQALSSSL